MPWRRRHTSGCEPCHSFLTISVLCDDGGVFACHYISPKVIVMRLTDRMVELAFVGRLMLREQQRGKSTGQSSIVRHTRMLGSARS